MLRKTIVFFVVFLFSFNIALAGAQSENYEIGSITISSQAESFQGSTYSGDVEINTFQPVINDFQSSTYSGTVYLYNSYTAPPSTTPVLSGGGGGSSSSKDYMQLEYEIDCENNIIKFTVTDRYGKLLKNTEINIQFVPSDAQGRTLMSGTTDENGELSLEITSENINYNVLSKKSGYYDYETNIEAACYDLINIVKTFNLIPLQAEETPKIEKQQFYVTIKILPEKTNTLSNIEQATNIVIYAFTLGFSSIK